MLPTRVVVGDTGAHSACSLCPSWPRGPRGWCFSSPPAPPIGLGFELQRLFVQRTDERLVLGRDDDHAGVGDGVTAPILFLVVPDLRAAGDEDVAVDDRAANVRVPTDANSRHQNALFDPAKAVHADVGTEHAAK